MIRSAAGKVIRAGRAAIFLVGLVVILALVLGVASTALAGNLDPLKIGSLKNVATKTTQLVGKVASGSAFVLNNPSGGPALGLQVNAGQAPLTVNADAGKATNLDADKLDGKDSSEFAAASNVKVGRLELNEPPGISGSAPSNSGTVLETGAFEIRGVCTNHPISSAPEPSLLVVAKQGANAIMHTPEGASTPSEAFNLGAGQSVQIAHILFTGDVTPDTFNTYVSYLAEAPSGILEGKGTIALRSSKCSFSATGVGQ